MIIYIHGFGSHGNGSKAIAFRDYCKSNNIPFIAPSLSTIPDLAIQTLEELIEAFSRFENVYLIGSSLGGYYAMYLSCKYTLPCVLINPAVYSYNTLQRAFGTSANYYDHSRYEWTKTHLESLKRYHIDSYQGENALLLVQTGDEVLDYAESVASLPKSRQIIEEGGNHTFVGFERHFDTIVGFFSSEDPTHG